MFDGGLPHDIMHDVFEGCVPLEISLLLGNFVIEKKYFSLEHYNDRLIRFDYNYTECDKPSPIGGRSVLTNRSLKLSASQAILLIRILPLLIGDHIPEDNPNWKCFMILCKIVDLVMCTAISADVCAVLQAHIEQHHKEFIALYSEALVIPKMHFFLHYTTQMLKIGPMTRSWNMRNEAKLNIFKQAGRLGNFTNISLSVAHRHQRLLCYELSTSMFLGSPLECGPSCDSPRPLSAEPKHVQDSLKIIISNASDETIVAYPKWLKKSGITIKKNADGFHPVFGKIVSMVILHVVHHDVDYFDHHFHAYVVLPTPYVQYDRLPDHSILHSHKNCGCVYIYLKRHLLYSEL